MIDFQPMITSRTTRFTMINHLSKYLGGLYKLYDGQFIYVPHQLSKEVKEKKIFYLENQKKEIFLDSFLFLIIQH
jgi:hypothetical protein